MLPVTSNVLTDVKVVFNKTVFRTIHFLSFPPIRWARLKDSLVDWRDRLGQSQSLQQFNREADEADSWIAEKLQMATDESYKDPTNLPVSLA